MSKLHGVTFDYKDPAKDGEGARIGVKAQDAKTEGRQVARRRQGTHEAGQQQLDRRRAGRHRQPAQSGFKKVEGVRG